MTHITICPACGACYEEVSEERANHPGRLCGNCWSAKAGGTRTKGRNDSTIRLAEAAFTAGWLAGHRAALEPLDDVIDVELRLRIDLRHAREEMEQALRRAGAA